MTKIERRRAKVTLYQGDYEQRLADLMEEAMSALRSEESGTTPRRMGTTSHANAKAQEYDALVASAEESAVKITVWALRWDEMDDLQEEHPPRDDEDRDKVFGLNMKTFPKALTQAALVTPGQASDLEDLKTKGRDLLAELELSRLHYRKLEVAAWNVNVGDDEIPKESLVSLLKLARDPDSKQQPDSGSVPPSSTDTSQPKRMSTSTPKATSPAEPSSPESPSGPTQPDPAP